MLALIGLPSCFTEPPQGTTSQQTTGATQADASSQGTPSTGEEDASGSDSTMGSPETGGSTGHATTRSDGGSTGHATTRSDGGSTDALGHECDDAPHVIFVNFDGVALTLGVTDDAPLNETSDPSAVQVWAPYANPDRDGTYQTVVDAFAPFDACLTDIRPNSGDYSMVVVTTDAHPSGALATVLDDCSNASGNRDIGLVLAPLGGYSTEAKGYVIASVIGALLGLGLVEAAEDDIMKASIATNDTGLVFGASCYPLAPSAFCGPTTCSGAMQSSRDYLEMIVGPAVTPVEPPVEIGSSKNRR